MIISLDAEKAFEKNPTSFHDRSLRSGRHIIKLIYSTSTVNSILRKPKAFHLKSRIRQGCPLSSYIFNIVFAFLARAIRQLKEIKGIQIGKEEVNVFLCAYDIILA